MDLKAAKRAWKRGENLFIRYIGEILAHGGLTFTWLDRSNLREGPLPEVLIASITEDTDPELLLRAAETGSEVVLFGGNTDWARRLGAEALPAIGPGYARVPHPGVPPLRFLRGIPWKAAAGKRLLVTEMGSVAAGAPGAPPQGPLITRFALGRGGVTRWAVNIPETVVSLQQGTAPVTYDGSPAPDGSANLDDGILKADDGFALDWEWDRAQTATGERYFPHPYGDRWRETFLRSLFHCVGERGWTLPFIDRWPDGLSQIAMISLDSDWNLDASADTTLDLLAECGIPATWCVMEPGYSDRVYARIQREEHELAFHYNAYDGDGGVWGETAFADQLQRLRQVTGQMMVSNKNHYTRFQGWGELFRWCEKNGIRSDQTRGPSKKGNIGFLFGTCQPYFPIAGADEENRLYNVLEIGFLTQDLNLGRLADTSVLHPFLEGVEKVRGVAHFLFHPIHLHREEGVRRAFRQVVQEAKRRGFRFWTGKAIDRWERGRRRLSITGLDDDGRPAVTGPPLLGGVVMVPLPEGAEADEGQVVTRYGVPCRKWPLQIVRGEEVPARSGKGKEDGG